MTPFNLDAALAGKPVVTRDGRKVLHLVNWPELGNWQVVACVEGEDGPTLYGAQGRFMLSADESAWDLYMAKETRTLWLNIQNLDPSYPFGQYRAYATEQEARQCADLPRGYLVIAHKVEVPA